MPERRNPITRHARHGPERQGMANGPASLQPSFATGWQSLHCSCRAHRKTCSRACRTSTKRRWCRRPCDCLRRLCVSRACTHKHTHTHTHTTTRIDTQALRCTRIHKHTHVRTNRSRGDILRKKGPHELAVVKEVDRLRTAVELCTLEHVVVPPPSLHPLGPRRLRAGPQLSPTHGGHCASTDGENANTMQRS